jgi:uroporphyrinogen-III decarboxylase
VYITLHKGADGFMSPDQFKTFYWPSLKELMLALIDEGLNPCPFFEGEYDTRLEHLKELPRGKVLAQFENTDLFRAKEIVGDTVCICGNVPISLLHAGSPDEVKDYCKKLIDTVGKGGGLIIAPKSVLDDAKPENVRAMIDFTKAYGVYG